MTDNNYERNNSTFLCRESSFILGGKQLVIVWLACPKHQKYEGRPVEDHPECELMLAALVDSFISGGV